MKKRFLAWLLVLCFLPSIPALAASDVDRDVLTEAGIDYVASDGAADYAYYHDLAQQLALQVSEEGFVLLKNDNDTLPLASDGTLKVNLFGVGAYALGGWGGDPGGPAPGGGSGEASGGSGEASGSSDEPAGGSGEASEIVNDGSGEVQEETHTSANTNLFSADYFVSSLDEGAETSGRIVYNAELADAYGAWAAEYSSYMNMSSYTASGIAGDSELVKSAIARNEWNLVNDIRDADGELLSAPMDAETMAQAKAFSDTAIVVLSRASGEGTDFEVGELRISENEAAMLSFVSQNFAHVIAVLKTQNTIEAGWLDGGTYTYSYYGYGGSSRNHNADRITAGTPGTILPYDEDRVYEFAPIDACFLFAASNSTGMGTAFGEILRGEINPSGRLPDTMEYRFIDDPVSVNAGHFETDDYNPDYSAAGNHSLEADQGDPDYYDTGYYYLVYEEGIYSGYLYFETFDHYAVQFPFGYGLSYTDFAWEVGAIQTGMNEYGELMLSVDVKVTNTGGMAGKDVVELYYTQPYYADGPYNVEKAVVNLGAFGKTELLQPGESQTLTLSLNARDMASWSDVVENYILEAGTYYVEIARDAGDAWEIYYGADAHAADAAEYLRSFDFDGSKAVSGAVTSMGIDLDELGSVDVSGWRVKIDQSYKDGADYILDQYGTLHFLRDEVTGTYYKNLFTGDVYGDGTYDYDATMIGELTDGYLHRADSSNGEKLRSAAEITAENMPEAPDERTEQIDFALRGMESAYEFDGVRLSDMEALEAAAGEVETNTAYYDQNGDRKNIMLSDIYRFTFDPSAADYHDTAAITTFFEDLGFDMSAYKTYDDALEDFIWEAYLAQFNIFELMTYFYCSGFECPAFLQYGIPASANADTPEQIQTKGANTISTTTFGPQLLACTWNTELSRQFGVALGGESVNSTSGTAATVMWYAPNLNAHRGVTGGRSGQNYSESAMLSGAICTAEVEGVQAMGVVCVVKHFFMNDAEYDREGVMTCASEQAIREVYGRAWERVVKAGAAGIMNSLGRVGTKEACKSYALNVSLLKDEWGFRGHVITDGYGVTRYMYPITELVYGNVGLLVMFNASNMSAKADYYELYEFYRAYPNAVAALLKNYAKDMCISKMETGTFWYWYADYTYDDYLASSGEDAAFGYADYGDPMWYTGKLALGYVVDEGNLEYYGPTNKTNLSGLAELAGYGLRYDVPAAKPGDTVTVPVSALDVTGLSDFELAILFDTDVFDLVDIQTDGGLLENGDYAVSWEAADRGADVTVRNLGQMFREQSGLLLTVTLRVKDNAIPGDYGVSLDTAERGISGKDAVYKIGYSVGVGETDWDVSGWEGSAYPDTVSDNWSEYFGNLGGSGQPTLTLAASYITVK